MRVRTGSISGFLSGSTANPYYIFLYKVKRKGICSHYPLERHIYAFRSATRAR